MAAADHGEAGNVPGRPAGTRVALERDADGRIAIVVPAYRPGGKWAIAAAGIVSLAGLACLGVRIDGLDALIGIVAAAIVALFPTVAAARQALRSTLIAADRSRLLRIERMPGAERRTEYALATVRGFVSVPGGGGLHGVGLRAAGDADPVLLAGSLTAEEQAWLLGELRAFLRTARRAPPA